MKNNKLAILLSGLVIVLLIALIAGLSVKNASDHGYAGGFSGFSFGGQAELRNTIEIPMSEIDSLNVEYGSKDLRIFTGDNDKVVIKEYLVNDSQQAWAQTEIVDRQANVKGGKNSTFMIFGFNIVNIAGVAVGGKDGSGQEFNGVKDISISPSFWEFS